MTMKSSHIATPQNLYATPTVLRIDSTPHSIDPIKGILEISGYEVITVTSGRKGVQKAIELQPKLIVINEFVIDMDCYELVKTVKNNAEIASIPILVLLILPPSEEEKRIYDVYMIKPVKLDEFRKQVTQLTL